MATARAVADEPNAALDRGRHSGFIEFVAYSVETARLLAQAGASVTITGRDPDRGACAAAAPSSFITGFTLHADGGAAA